MSVEPPLDCISPPTGREGRATDFPCLSVVAAVGFLAMVTQAVLVRELFVIFFGSELSLGLIFSSWLAWIGIGSALGRRVTAPPERCRLWLGLAAGAAFLAPVGEVVLARFSRWLLHTAPGTWVTVGAALCITLICVAPLCALVGFLFPLAPRALQQQADAQYARTAWVYGVEAVGSLAGGIAFTVAMELHLSALLCLTVLAAAGGLLSCWFVWRHTAAGARSRGTALLLAGVGLVLLVKQPTLERWSFLACWRSLTQSPELKLVRWEDTQYQRVAVGKMADQYDVFCDGQYAFAFPDPYVARQTAALLLSQLPHAGRVLILGAGAEDLVAELMRTPGITVDVVQIDPRLAAIVARYRGAAPASGWKQVRAERHRVRWLFTDGRFYVRHTKRRYDFVFVHLPDPSTALVNRYYTAEFHHDVRRILRPGGVLATTSISSTVYLGDALRDCLATLYRTLRHEFPHVLVMPGEQAIFFATNTDGILTSDFDTIARRMAALKVPEPEVYTALVESQFLGGQSEAQTQEFQRAHVGINSDLSPVLYFLHVRLWAQQNGSRLTARVTSLHRTSVIALLVAVLVLCLGWGVGWGRRRWSVPVRRLIAGQLAATAGFAAMGQETIVLLLFQTVRGSLYQAVALMAAAFMFGFALGSGAAAAPSVRRSDPLRCGFAGVLAVALLAASTPILVTALAGTGLPLLGIDAAFSLLLLFSGFLTGFLLPLAVAIGQPESKEIGSVTALVNRSDHWGAALGAATCGTLLLPLLSLRGVCWFLTAVCIACAVPLGLRCRADDE